MIDNTINIYTHLKEKKYTLVVSDVRNIFKERFCVDKINPGHEKEPKRIYAIIDFLIDYGSTLAEMAEAKNSKEAYAALDRIAAPVGSSRIKKETVFSISLNAYGGGFIGKEYIEGITDKSRANSYGISAPIGLAVSLGRIKANKDNNPNLRKVTPELNEYANSKYSRLSLGLYVDIPVFMFARRKYW